MSVAFLFFNINHDRSTHEKIRFMTHGRMAIQNDFKLGRVSACRRHYKKCLYVALLN